MEKIRKNDIGPEQGTSYALRVDFDLVKVCFYYPTWVQSLDSIERHHVS